MVTCIFMRKYKHAPKAIATGKFSHYLASSREWDPLCTTATFIQLRNPTDKPIAGALCDDTRFYTRIGATGFGGICDNVEYLILDVRTATRDQIHFGGTRRRDNISTCLTSIPGMGSRNQTALCIIRTKKRKAVLN